MRLNLLFVLFFSTLSLIATAKTLNLQKLTGQGVLEIQYESPKIRNDGPADQQWQQVKVNRKVTPLEKSKWKNLAKIEDLKIAIIGDTGCRLKENKKGEGEYQDCKDPKVWPFHQVMKQVMKEKPDLILHVGDYHYREHCSAGKECQKYAQAVGYGVEPWNLDFFEPIAVTYNKTPWILVRGNHEDCNRAYLGYFRLMANEELSGPCLAYEDPDFVVLKDLLIINFDSASLPDAIDPSSENAKIWIDRLKEVEKKIDASGIKHVWLITHKPIYGLVKFNGKVTTVSPNFKKYTESTNLLSKIEMILAGHVHVSQMIKATGKPVQFILGNGGTMLDDFGDLTKDVDLKGLGLDQIFTSSPGYGYAIFQRSVTKAKWTMEFKTESGQVTSRCEMASTVSCR